MTKKQEELLDQLISVAGNPEIVFDAIRSLNAEGDHDPSLEKIVGQILRIRKANGEFPVASAT